MNDIIGHYLYELSYISYMASFIRNVLLLWLIGPNKTFATQDQTRSYPFITRYSYSLTVLVQTYFHLFR